MQLDAQTSQHAMSSSSAGLSSFLASQTSEPARLHQQALRDRRQLRQQTVWEGDDDDDDGAADSAVRQHDKARDGPDSGSSSDEEEQASEPQQVGQAQDDEEEDGGEDAVYGKRDRSDTQLSNGIRGNGRGRGRGGRSTRDWELIASERLKQQQSIDAEADEQSQQQAHGQQGQQGQQPKQLLGKRRRDESGAAVHDVSAHSGSGNSSTAELAGDADSAGHARALRQLFDKKEGEQFESFDNSGTAPRSIAGAATALPLDRGEDEAESDPWLQQVDATSKRRVQQQQPAPANDEHEQPTEQSALVTQPPPRTERHQPFTLQPFSANTAKLLIIQKLCRDDETPQAALRRLAGSSVQGVTQSGSAKEVTRKKNQRTKPSKSSGQHAHHNQQEQSLHQHHAELAPDRGADSTAASEDKTAFLFLTDICAQCVREGMYDVYSITRRQLAASVNAAQQQQQQQQQSVQQVEADNSALPQPAMSDEDDTSSDAQYVVKASDESAVVLGPFTASQLQQQQQQAELDSSSAVYRRVGHSRWLPLSQF